MHNCKRNTLLILLLVVSNLSYAQDRYTPTRQPLTADSLATGNYKDVLTSFFQLGLNNFTGNDKELSFTSNPYAIMARANPEIFTDTLYYRYRHLRAFNFNVAARLDSNFHLSGFKFGGKYAIVNKRDETISKKFLADAIFAEKNSEYYQFNRALNLAISSMPASALKTKIRMQTDSLLHNSSYTFDKLGIEAKDTIMAVVEREHLDKLKLLIANDPKVNICAESQKSYADLKAALQNQPLWTIAANTVSLNNRAFFANAEFSSEFLLGMTDAKKNYNLELDIKASDVLTNDSLQGYKNLNTNTFTFEPGLNLVFKSKNTSKSFLEFKISGSYYHIFSGVAAGNVQDSSTINGELRIRVFSDIWVPISIKYDPKNGNVFGLLNVHANFSALASLFNNSN
jgi:hypothetical protein